MAAAPTRAFDTELEFVSMLLNPAYVQWLSNEGLLSQAPFLRYLRALHETWRQPAYAAHLPWPAALTVLELLAWDADFRAAAAAPAFAHHLLARTAAAAAAAGAGGRG